jgi:hypothetical protein
VPQFISDETEWTLIPDLVVMDQGFVYTGLRDARGHKILRRVSRPIGFVHHGNPTEYVTEPPPDDTKPVGTPERNDDDIHEGEGLEW